MGAWLRGVFWGVGAVGSYWLMGIVEDIVENGGNDEGTMEDGGKERKRTGASQRLSNLFPNRPSLSAYARSPPYQESGSHGQPNGTLFRSVYPGLRPQHIQHRVVGKRKEDSLDSHVHRNVRSDKDTRSLLTIHCNY